MAQTLTRQRRRIGGRRSAPGRGSVFGRGSIHGENPTPRAWCSRSPKPTSGRGGRGRGALGGRGHARAPCARHLVRFRGERDSAVVSSRLPALRGPSAPSFLLGQTGGLRHWPTEKYPRPIEPGQRCFSPHRKYSHSHPSPPSALPASPGDRKGTPILASRALAVRARSGRSANRGGARSPQPRNGSGAQQTEAVSAAGASGCHSMRSARPSMPPSFIH